MSRPLLFRLRYLRDGKPRGCTFGAKDLVEAMNFYELWEKMNPGIKELEMVGLPPSRWNTKPHASGRTKAEQEYFGTAQ